MFKRLIGFWVIEGEHNYYKGEHKVRPYNP